VGTPFALLRAAHSAQAPQVEAARPPPPGPKGLDLLKILARIRTDRIGAVETIRRQYGDIAQIAFGPVRLVLVSDLDVAHDVLRDSRVFSEKGIGLHEASYFLGQGLLTASGKAWSSARPPLAGCFRRDGLDFMLTQAAAATASTLQTLEDLAEASKPVDFQPFASRIALETISAEIFRSRSPKRSETILADFAVLARWVEARLLLPLDPLTHLAWLAAPRARRAYARLAALCSQPSTPGPGGGSVADAMQRQCIATPDSIRDQMMTLLAAGHETTSAAVCWTLDLLSRHRAIAERVSQEARAALHGPLTATIASHLPLTCAVVKEALRLYPPVWVLPRRAAGPTQIGPYWVAGGTNILINVYGIHRNPAYWRDPDCFEPDRFRGADSDPLAYMPFGKGARKCIGVHLGQAQTILIVAMVLARFRLAPSTRSTAPLAGLTLRPRDGLPLQLSLLD
jgi:enediyne biosynthesis protein E7